MDRSDERNDHPGSILNIGETAGSNLPAEGGSPTVGGKVGSQTTLSEEERRRRRMREGADEIASATSEKQRGSGATSVDMGAGGEGTDVER
jgi:hypothetical protein